MEGTARDIGGKIQEGIGRATDDAATRVKGVANQATGKAQELYGRSADAARDSAGAFEQWLRDSIETQPYTSVLIAAGLGWLLGRLHRPL